MTNIAQNFDAVFSLLNKSKKILLLTHARADADGLGSMISMYLVLKELGKEVTAVTADPTPDSLDFLPAMDIVQHSLASAKDFIITLDCSKTPVNKIKYNLEDQRVNIIISPKQGTFRKEDVSFSQGPEDQYNLIMTFDTGNLEHLGVIYDQNTEMFFKTPLVNVDHHASNTDFGQVNVVDVMAASTTQVVLELLKEMGKRYNKKLITKDIATLLLAGLITDTGSFQHANTSPQAMETAAELMDLGARQQEIIKNVYKTKKLSTLKLWGIVLSKVQVDPVYRMVWSAVSREDLKKAGAASEETGSIIDDLLSNAPGAEVIMLIKHSDDGVIGVSMRSTSNAVDVGKLCAEMGGGGHVRAAGFKVKDGRTFEQVVNDVIKKVKEYQAKRLNIRPEDLERAQPAAVIAKPAPKLPLGDKKPGETPSGKETIFEFKAKPGPTKQQPQPAAQAPKPMEPEKKKKPEAPKLKKQESPKTAKPTSTSKPTPAPAPAPAPKPAPAPATPPKPVVQAPAAQPTPPAPPAPPTAQKPAPKSDASPDVPDWLKAE